MILIVFNIYWMIYNMYLAVLPVIFAWFLFRMPHRVYTAIVGFLWFLYLPNTIYVFTDLHHLVEQWPIVDTIGKIILVFQYAILEIVGLTCFLIAFYPIELILQKLRFSSRQQVLWIISINFLLGFAMVIGKFERVNSWDVFLNPQFVVTSVFHTLLSWEMVVLIILFGLFANLFYFLLRKKAELLYKKWIK